MKKIILILFTLIGCNSKPNNAFNEITKGEKKNQIIKKLGNPDEITKCDKNLWWGNGDFLGEDVNKNCKSYFIYKKRFLSKWGIGFDKNDKVISKYIYVSE